jgi:hypothetical protein
MSINLSIYQSINLSIYLSINLCISTYLYLYLSLSISISTSLLLYYKNHKISLSISFHGSAWVPTGSPSRYATSDNGSPALWLNQKSRHPVPSTASGSRPQLCRCGEARALRRYQWRVGAWSVCSRSCGTLEWSDDDFGGVKHWARKN